MCPSDQPRAECAIRGCGFRIRAVERTDPYGFCSDIGIRIVEQEPKMEEKKSPLTKFL